MIKEQFCEKCNCLLDIQKICDTCGMILLKSPICELGDKFCMIKGNPIELIIEGFKYDFCSVKCLLKFIVSELNKQQPKGEENEN